MHPLHAVLLAFALMLPATGPVLAQLRDQQPRDDQSREILLGTIKTGDPGSAREAGPESRGEAAAALLADGIAALDRGDVMIGRQSLRLVIERYPETRAAGTARRELDALQATAPTRSDRRATSVGGWLSASPPEGPAKEAKDSRVAQDERRLATLTNDMQNASGDRIFFGEASADLGARARAVLAGQARWLARHPDVVVYIEAHADDNSDREAEIAISERRGQAVRQRLIEEGVDPGRITVYAFGRDRPIALCSAPECAVQNRRAVTRLGTLPASGSADRRGPDAPAYATVPSRERRRD